MRQIVRTKEEYCPSCDNYDRCGQDHKEKSGHCDYYIPKEKPMSKCGTCKSNPNGEGCINDMYKCINFSKYRPYAVECSAEESMENKVIFESEEEAREVFSQIFLTSGIVIDNAVMISKQKGYIRKSAVEEAEELDNKFDIYYSIPENRMDSDKQWIRDACKLVMAYRGAIQEQKKEIERLKNG